jgi:hypothetical protein
MIGNKVSFSAATLYKIWNIGSTNRYLLHIHVLLHVATYTIYGKFIMGK